MDFTDYIYKQPKVLLSSENAKTVKGELLGYKTLIMYMSPDRQNTTGKSVCSSSTEGCRKSCLFTAGRGKFNNIMTARLHKTEYFLRDRENFMNQLVTEISKAVNKFGADKICVRFNGTSDIPFENISIGEHQNIMAIFKDVQFYDYTKLDTKPLEPNHHITYSSTGIEQKAGYNGLDHDVPNIHQNWDRMRRNLDRGDNVAMAFTHKDELPSHVIDEETGNKYRVVDGDSHDFRPLDKTLDGEKGVIVGLGKKADNMGHMIAADKSKGFLVHYDPQYMRQGNKPNGKLIRDDNGKPIKTNDQVIIPTQPKPPSMRKIIPIAGE